MKKKIIFVLCILVVIIMLFPVPIRLKDGGTVEYTAVLYKVSDVHRIADSPKAEGMTGFYEGTVVEILGFEVFNNVIITIN